MKPHRGTLILVLGILSIVMCGIFTAIPAWIMGNTDLAEMNAGTMDSSGRGLTNAGRIMGMIICIISILGIIAVIGIVGLGAAAGM